MRSGGAAAWAGEGVVGWNEIVSPRFGWLVILEDLYVGQVGKTIMLLRLKSTFHFVCAPHGLCRCDEFGAPEDATIVPGLDFIKVVVANAKGLEGVGFQHRHDD